MVKSYSRHGPTQVFGLITSPAATSYTAISSTDSNTYAYVPAWEDVNVFDVRKGEKVGEWHVPGGREEVVKICSAPRRSSGRRLTEGGDEDEQEDENDEDEDEEKIFAVAYADGSIRVWASSFPNSSSSEGFSNQAYEIVTFNGHKKSPTALTFSSSGDLLFSGGVEGEIVVWDVLGEVGLFRLKGHRGGVSGIKYLPHPDTAGSNRTSTKAGFLVSTSKDGMMKLWDLDTRHCLQTVVVGRGEVFSLDVRQQVDSNDGFESMKEDEGVSRSMGRWTILTGSGNGDVRVWEVTYDNLRSGIKEDSEGNLNQMIHPVGPLPLPNSSTNTSPIQSVTFHPNSRIPLIFVQTSDKTVQVVRIRSEDEMEARRARKRRREREKAKDKKKGADADDEMLADEIKIEDGSDGITGTWLERITDFCIVRVKAKIRSFSLIDSESSGALQILLQLNNNSLETWTVPAPPVESASGSVLKKLKALAGSSGVIEPERKYTVEHSGHRADVRTLCVSSDDQVVASASNGQLKLWNLKTGVCIRTMECGYAICSVFLPGDRHVVVGTKGGTLELFDLPSATLLQSVQAHSGPVWGIDVRPDKAGLVTGSADKDVKFWDIRMREVAGEGSKILTRLGEERVIKTKQLSLVHTKTLKMTDDVLAVKYSPDNKLLAVSLLDSTVKVFFQDTLKFFLSLYGHKLPVLSMDISQDSKLIITSSADKNIKIWGLDFGDCHKSIFAHEESIMSVGFEKGMGHDGFGSTGRGSHLFWSIGKDGLVKYWDGDKFDLIQTLRGHHSEIWSLALSHFGDFVVTGGGDRGIRVWERTEDPLFLEEEREREMEQTYETTLLSTLNREQRAIGSGAGGADGENEQDPDAGGAEDGSAEADAVKKQTAESLMAGEKILEALELCESDAQTWRDYEESLAKAPAGVREGLLPPPRNPRMTALAREGDPAEGITGAEYVRRVVEGLKGPGLEDALLVLPFDRVKTLVGCLEQWIKQRASIPLASRILFFLLRTHHHQIVSTRHLRTTLVSLRINLRDALKHEREILGYNLAGLKYVKRLDEAERIAGVLEGEMDEKKVKEKIDEGLKKRKRVGVVA